MNIPPIGDVKIMANLMKNNDNVPDNIPCRMNIAILHSSTLGLDILEYHLTNECYNNEAVQNYLTQLFNAGYYVKSYIFDDSIAVVIRWNRPAEMRLNIDAEEYDRDDEN